MLAVSWFGWQQYQQFVDLQQRFAVLDSRLNNTDESVNQSGAAMQINIGKHSEELKKHWSEIKKLWGVANDKNKTKIRKNIKDIKFLASSKRLMNWRLWQITRIDLRCRVWVRNYFGLSADMDKLTQSLNDYLLLNKLKLQLNQQQQQIQNNIDAVNSIDGFADRSTKKMLNLRKKSINRVLRHRIWVSEQYS